MRSPLGQVRELMKGLFLPVAMSSLGGWLADCWLTVAIQNLLPATASRVLVASRPGEEEVDLTVLLVSDVGEVGKDGEAALAAPNASAEGRGGGRQGPKPCGSE